MGYLVLFNLKKKVGWYEYWIFGRRKAREVCGMVCVFFLKESRKGDCIGFLTEGEFEGS